MPAPACGRTPEAPVLGTARDTAELRHGSPDGGGRLLNPM